MNAAFMYESRVAWKYTIAVVVCCIGTATLASEPGALRDGKSAASLPELPPVLAGIKASRRGHGEVHGAVLVMKNKKLGIRLSTEQPLSAAQWDAVAALEPRWLTFNDKSLCDDDMDRLVAIDPEEIHLRIIPLTGAGAKRFGDMKRLVKLATHHMKRPTPEAREALINHPALEDYRTAGDFCIDALEAPRLKSVELADEALIVTNIKTLARRSTITTLILFSHNQTRVDSKLIAEVAAIRSLETLRICKTVLPYGGGLEHLARLPQLSTLDLIDVDVSGDGLDRLREALPRVKLRHEPMKPDYRLKWDEMVAKQSEAASSAP